MGIQDAPKQGRGKIILHHQELIAVLGLVGALVFGGMLLVIQNPKFITASSAFSANGYLAGLSPQGYLQLVVSLLAIIAGASVGACAMGFRASWYWYSNLRTRKLAYGIVNWLAVIVLIGFITSLFLLILPVSQIGAYSVLGTLTSVFGLVAYFSLWAKGLPEDLVNSRDLDTPLQELQTIDLESSMVRPMLEKIEDVHPDASVVVEPSAQVESSSLDPTTREAFEKVAAFHSHRGAWADLLLAAIPGFFGLMGLAQLKEGRWTRGTAFLAGGIAIGVLSSWYLILPARIGEYVARQPMPPANSLSWLSNTIADQGTLGWVIPAMLAAFLVLWIVQLFDAVRFVQKV